jgi:hypothetical protein
LEDVVVEAPFGDSAAVDVEVMGDGRVGFAHDKELDGVLLAGRERGELRFECGEVAAVGRRSRRTWMGRGGSGERTLTPTLSLRERGKCVIGATR